jgi:hypothetical protein
VRVMADTGDGQDDDGLGLDEVLKALRHDLLEAQRDGDAENTGLAVQTVEIELSVEVTRHVDAKGEVGAKWFVLSGSASGEASRDRTSTNRITLTLGPLSHGGDATPATTDRPIAGADVSAGVLPQHRVGGDG